MNLKKNYIEIINENSDYNFNKELLQIIKTSVNSNTVNSNTVNSNTVNSDTVNSDTVNSDTVNNDTVNSDTVNNDTVNSDNFINYILYGPSCSYKYKNALKLLQHFSPSNLKYEKKLHINLVKTDFYIKISDIHYEIDVENFIYNSKSSWNDIYTIIYNSIASSYNKKGYIVFRNFDKINYDLLDLLYNYMQKELFSSLTIKYIIITESISFIPYKIISMCKVLYFSKLNKKTIQGLCNKSNKQFFKYLNINNPNNTDSIKQICHKVNNPNIFSHLDISNNLQFIEHYKSICDTYIELITSVNYNIKNIRTLLYDILIYHLNCHECFYYIIKTLIQKELIVNNKISDLIYNSLIFFKNYNNNYRPIFHLESFTLYLIELIHENK
jgi:hypothetical protein